MTIRVAIDGVGGLGRHFFLASVGGGFADLFQVTTILEDAELSAVQQRLSLDSRYGRSPLSIGIDGDELRVNGEPVSVRSLELGKNHDWDSEGVDIVVVALQPGEPSDRLLTHIERGAKKVIGIGGFAGSDAVIVAGLNEEHYDPDKHHLVSTGSSAGVRAATLYSLVSKVEDVRHAHFTIVEPPDQSAHQVDQLGSDGYRRSIAGNILACENETTDLHAGEALLPDSVMIRRIIVPSDGAGWIQGFFRSASSNIMEEDLGEALLNASGSDTFLGLISREPGKISARDVLGSSQSLVLDSSSIQVGRNGSVSLTAWFDVDWSLACRGVDLLALICESGVPGTA